MASKETQTNNNTHHDQSTLFSEILEAISTMKDSPVENPDSFFFDIGKPIDNTETEDSYTEKKAQRKKLDQKNIFSNFLKGQPISSLPRMNKERKFDFFDSEKEKKPFSKYEKTHFSKSILDNTKPKRTMAKNTKKNRYNANYYQHFYTNLNAEEKSIMRKDFSVDVSDMGKPLRIFESAELDESKMDLNLAAKDLYWCGKSNLYNRRVDKITPKNTLLLKRSTTPSKLHTKKFILNDDFINECVSNKYANLFISDVVLSTIMATTKSNVGWDIMVRKENDCLFFFKRDQSELDKEFLSEALSKSNEEQRKLLIEATTVRDSFCSSAVLQNSLVDLSSEFSSYLNSTEDIKKKIDEKGYRYRQFDLSPQIRMVVKCGVDALRKKDDKSLSPINLKALVQFSPSMAGNSWRSRLEVQKGSVLVDEIRKNAFCVTRWVSQCLIADSDELRIAFVSRKNNTKPYEHEVQATIKEPVKSVEKQLGVSESNLWALFRVVAEEIFNQEIDGNYILVKDPNNNCLLLFKTQ